MPSKPRTLTKSRFKLATECPTKLYFTGKPQYGNTKNDNAFLKALAEGGFQVGELAKLYYPGGTEILTTQPTQAIEETKKLIEASQNLTLYEPAFCFAELLVRVDIFVKRGNQVQLYEVKAKSFDFDEGTDSFYDKRQLKKGNKAILGKWRPYLIDIAFQTYVVRKCFPDATVTSHLLLADKSKRATVDGLNQNFFLAQDDSGRTRAITAPGLRAESLGERILSAINVNDEIQVLLEGKHGTSEQSFEDYVATLASAYAQDKMIAPQVSSQCKGCEFRIAAELKAQGLKSGFDECWKKAVGFKPSTTPRPFVFEVWNYRGADQVIEDQRYFMDELTEEDFNFKARDDGEAGLSQSERQWLQVQKVTQKDSKPHVAIDDLRAELNSWTYPLHFIDFETTMVAIPFHQGMRPYEQIAFQFSHHTIDAKGHIEHKTQYIHTERGKLPNFDFVRALKKALEGDQGTIFRYATHENTVLCQILAQLRESQESDREELIAWIKTITQSPGDSVEKWEGARNMVDLCELVKRYYYHPLTSGSNSIKKVLPAILKDSRFLEERYSKPVYGAADGVKSLNFKNWAWIKRGADGVVMDPYKLLEPIFSDLDLETMDSLITEGSIADGGAAMTAYARMQFTQMSDAERERVTKALLRYCELDTFAMVLIYEYWRQLLSARSAEHPPVESKDAKRPRRKTSSSRKVQRVASSARKSRNSA